MGAHPLALWAVAIVVVEALVAALGAPWAPLSALLLVVAPGLALSWVLPAGAALGPVGRIAAAPALGTAASSVALISLAAAGVELTPVSVRLTLGALVLAGALVSLRLSDPPWDRSRELWALGGLALALLFAVVLQGRVLSGSPVPGNDWAKYLLYADEIARQRSLLIDNPLWMLGVPFREDPGVPSLYGSFLVISGARTGVLMHGIWVFGLAAVLSVFAMVRAFWGTAAACCAAALWAVLPINHDILGWHGLANVAAIALMPLVLMYLGVLLTQGLRPREGAGLGLVVIAIAAAHRLSLGVVLVATLAVLVAGFATGKRRQVLRGLLAAVLAGVVLAPGVVYDLLTRGRTFGGTQPYSAYLSAKVDLGLLAGDLTPVFTVAAIVAVALGISWARRDRLLWPVIALLGVTVALGYAWLVHLPLVYFRMAYYLPLALVPLVALAFVRLLGARRGLGAVGVLVAVLAVFAWSQASNVREFYSFAGPASLRGLDSVAASMRKGEVVVTDRCWSFLGTWLLHTRTLPALEPEDVQPRAELRRAAQAKEILRGTPSGAALARRLGVRYALVDPTCTDVLERPVAPPRAGRPVFVSHRLAVLRLDAHR